MLLNSINQYINDYISLLKKDLLQIIDSLIVDKIIDSSFNKLNLSIDFFSKSKQGDVSSNIYIILKKYLYLKNKKSHLMSPTKLV